MIHYIQSFAVSLINNSSCFQAKNNSSRNPEVRAVADTEIEINFHHAGLLHILCLLFFSFSNLGFEIYAVLFLIAIESVVSLAYAYTPNVLG